VDELPPLRHDTARQAGLPGEVDRIGVDDAGRRLFSERDRAKIPEVFDDEDTSICAILVFRRMLGLPPCPDKIESYDRYSFFEEGSMMFSARDSFRFLCKLARIA